MECIRSTGTMEEIRNHLIQKEQRPCCYKKINSPIGPIVLVASHNALLRLSWGSEEATTVGEQHSSKGEGSGIIAATVAQLAEYFRGKRRVFSLPLAPSGTAFQKLAWEQLLIIPYGQSINYGEQARRLGRPNSARAVGAANGKNPIGIIIPCHRVIGASGHLTGFAGGLAMKRQLLELEGALFEDGKILAKHPH